MTRVHERPPSARAKASVVLPKLAELKAPKTFPHIVAPNENLGLIARREHARLEAVIAANPGLVPARISPRQVIRIPRERVRHLSRLARGADERFSVAQLWPICVSAGKLHRIDPKILMGIVMQESMRNGLLVNHALHRDGFGRGLIGLDPRGELPQFQLWSAESAKALKLPPNTFPPEWQIEYLALRLREYAKDRSIWDAVLAWHSPSGRDTRYVADVRARIQTLSAGHSR